MALIPWIALTMAFVISKARLPFAPAPILAGLTVLASILHPARRDLFGSFHTARVNRVMLAMTMIAFAPLVTFAAANIGLQKTGTSDHAALGHYGFMASFSFAAIGVALLASLRPEGWKLTAWVAGLLPALLGLVSLLFPDVDSHLGLPWALAAITWGIVFLAVAKFTGDADDRIDVTSSSAASKSEGS